MMEQALVMTIIGPDRPGLVQLVAAMVAEHQGNWLESRMSRLGGYFAGILRVTVPESRRASLVSALETLAWQGLSVIVHPDGPQVHATPGQTRCLEVVGQDRPGIVKSIAQALARFNVNVEELNSETCSAPMSGETLFKANALLHLPAACDLPQLQRELEKIAADLIVDVSLREPGADPRN
jgi:glycine cleavage system regulatory protein